jgi:hypothetical protein
LHVLPRSVTSSGTGRYAIPPTVDAHAANQCIEDGVPLQLACRRAESEQSCSLHHIHGSCGSAFPCIAMVEGNLGLRVCRPCDVEDRKSVCQDEQRVSRWEKPRSGGERSKWQTSTGTASTMSLLKHLALLEGELVSVMAVSPGGWNEGRIVDSPESTRRGVRGWFLASHVMAVTMPKESVFSKIFGR